MHLLARPLIAGLRWTLGDDIRTRFRPESVRTVLLVELTRLGDAVTLLYLLRSLRVSLSNAQFAVLADSSYVPLLVELCPGVSFLGIRRPDRPFGVVRAMRAARRAGPDLAISVSPAYRNAAVVLASGAPLKAGYLRTGGSSAPSLIPNPLEGIGFDAPDGIVYEGEGWLERRRKVLDVLGLEGDFAAGSFSLPSILKQELLGRLRARNLLNGRPHIVVHPFSSWKFRSWPAARYLSLIERVVDETGVDVVVLGGPQDGRAMDLFIRHFEGSGRVRCFSCVSLLEGAAVIGDALLLVGNDSGPLHLASALGTPAVGVYGPSDPRHTAPPRVRAIYHKAECSPCGQRDCVRKDDPCLARITVDEVVCSLKELLVSDPRPKGE